MAIERMLRARACALSLVVLSMQMGLYCIDLDDVVLSPEREMPYTPARYGLEFNEVTLPISDGRAIVCWHVRSEESKGLILIVPGSDGNKSIHSFALSPFIPNGYDVVMMDYEGFGNSPGDPNLARITESARVAARFARSQHSRVFLFGVSLGSPVATQLATEESYAGLILEGTVLMEHQARVWLRERGHPDWLADGVDRGTRGHFPDDFDILTNIRSVEERKLFLHSPADEVTPYENALRVYEAASEPKEFRHLRHKHGRMLKREDDRYTWLVVSWLNNEPLPSSLKDDE